ncbi:hypothetical protein CDAR_55802 [Caerostris darwini]|uniref:Uncharacterized protein n=1 Tax=Caerostris darwini TaxID=1538125 RepID=A0AAV4V8K9_9ARAC|nr:hypothetical protein CDAR_55802 [Caerostris darwini]
MSSYNFKDFLKICNTMNIDRYKISSYNFKDFLKICNTMDIDRYKIMKVAGGATLVIGGATVALPLLGFTSSGVAAGSVAAGIQSKIGCVVAGSYFATAQSAGAAGMALGTKAILGASGATMGWFLPSKL